eukprot:COSAG02_NODE_1554_length_11948_cov_41.539455_1_plen_746_part_00
MQAVSPQEVAQPMHWSGDRDTPTHGACGRPTSAMSARFAYSATVQPPKSRVRPASAQPRLRTRHQHAVIQQGAPFDPAHRPAEQLFVPQPPCQAAGAGTQRRVHSQRKIEAEGMLASSRVECPDRWLAGQFAARTQVWQHGTLKPSYDSSKPPRLTTPNLSKVVRDSQLLPPHHVWRSETARTARELAVRMQKEAASKNNTARPASVDESQKERFRRLAEKVNRRRPTFSGTGVPPPNAVRHVYSIPADRLYSVSPLRKQSDVPSGEKIQIWRQGKWTTQIGFADQREPRGLRQAARKGSQRPKVRISRRSAGQTSVPVTVAKKSGLEDTADVAAHEDSASAGDESSAASLESVTTAAGMVTKAARTESGRSTVKESEANRHVSETVPESAQVPHSAAAVAGDDPEAVENESKDDADDAASATVDSESKRDSDMGGTEAASTGSSTLDDNTLSTAIGVVALADSNVDSASAISAVQYTPGSSVVESLDTTMHQVVSIVQAGISDVMTADSNLQAKSMTAQPAATETGVLEALDWMLAELEATSANDAPKAVIELVEPRPKLDVPNNVVRTAAGRFIGSMLSSGVNAALLAMVDHEGQAPGCAEAAVLVSAIEEVNVGDLARHMSRERAKTGVTHRARERKPTEIIQFDHEEDVLFSVVAQFSRQEPAEDDMEDDLYFETGAIIDVFQEGNLEGWGDEWAIGHVAGTVATARGFFPLNFTRRLTEEEQESENDRIAADRRARFFGG